MKGDGVGDEDLEEVFRTLKSVVADVDPVPPDVLAAGRDAISVRTLDADLAELVYDSARDHQLLATVRSIPTTRQLTFEASDQLVEIELAPAGRTTSLVGQIVPVAAGRVEVRHSSGSVSVGADELGRFSVPTVPTGPLSLRIEVEGRAPTVTDWVVT